MRFSNRLWIIGAVLLLVIAAGCKSTTGGGAGRGHPTYYEVDPSFKPEGTVRIPVLGFANASEEAEAVGYFYPYLEEALREKPTYVLISKWTVQRDARRKNMKEQCNELDAQWRADRAFDPDLLREFADMYEVDYVMGGEINEWSETEVEMNVEGYSHSDVEASLAIIEVASNKIVFQMKSAHYDPGNLEERMDGGIVRGESRVVPQPPPIDEVAQRVAVHLVSALP
jgi:hypothetical protein